jgi:hypothetical protein
MTGRMLSFEQKRSARLAWMRRRGLVLHGSAGHRADVFVPCGDGRTDMVWGPVNIRCGLGRRRYPCAESPA